MTKFIHQRFFKQFVQFTLTLVWVAMLSSCIDNHYDIDKIDSTIGIGGDDFSLLGDNSTNVSGRRPFICRRRLAFSICDVMAVSTI